MNDNTKEDIRLMVDEAARMKSSNPPTYWMMLAGAGAVITMFMGGIFKSSGLMLIIVAASVYILNDVLMKWTAKREAEKKAVQTEIRRAKRTAKPPVPEQNFE